MLCYLVHPVMYLYSVSQFVASVSLYYQSPDMYVVDINVLSPDMLRKNISICGVWCLAIFWTSERLAVRIICCSESWDGKIKSFLEITHSLAQLQLLTTQKVWLNQSLIALFAVFLFSVHLFQSSSRYMIICPLSMYSPSWNFGFNFAYLLNIDLSEEVPPGHSGDRWKSIYKLLKT